MVSSEKKGIYVSYRVLHVGRPTIRCVPLFPASYGSWGVPLPASPAIGSAPDWADVFSPNKSLLAVVAALLRVSMITSRAGRYLITGQGKDDSLNVNLGGTVHGVFAGEFQKGCWILEGLSIVWKDKLRSAKTHFM